MGDVEPARGRHRPRQLDQLLGAGIVAGRIDQGRRDPERAVGHRVPDHGAHGVELGGGRGSLGFALGVDPHRRRAQEGSEVLRSAVGLHRGQPGREAMGAAEVGGRGAEPGKLRVGRGGGVALAHDFSGDPLGHLADAAAVPQRELVVRLTLDIDEAGSHHQAARVDVVPRPRGREYPAGRHSGEPIALDGDVAIEPPGAGSVHHPAASDDQVVVRVVGTGSPGGSIRRAGGEREEGPQEQSGHVRARVTGGTGPRGASARRFDAKVASRAAA